MKLDKKNVFTLLQNNNTYGSVLYLCLLHYYRDLHELDSLEIYSRIQDDFSGEMSQENESKLQAILAAITTPYFYTDLEVFVSVCRTLLSNDPGILDFNYNEVSIKEVIWSLYEVNLIEDDNAPKEFANTIDSYIQNLIKDETLGDDSLDASNVVSAYDQFMLQHILKLKEQLIFAGFNAEDIQLPSIEN